MTNAVYIFQLILAGAGLVNSQDNSVVLGCDVGWQPANGNCYFFSKKGVQWQQANDECNLVDSSLISFDSVDELNWFMTFVPQNFPSSGYWTALNDLPPDGTGTIGTGNWVWFQSDRPADGVINWNQSPANDGVANCGGINVQGYMADVDCNAKQGYICEMDGTSCLLGWLSTNRHCYWMSDTTDPAQRLSWSDAVTRCKTKGGANARLITINDLDNQAFVQGQLPYLAKTTKVHWTGLTYTNGAWKWYNNEPAMMDVYYNWQSPPANSTAAGCAALNLAGYLQDQSCSAQQGFMCEMDLPVDGSGCLLGWLTTDTACYWVSDVSDPSKLVSWTGAQQACVTNGDSTAKLLTINSPNDVNFIANQLQYLPQTNNILYWTGLQFTQNSWKWATGDTAQSPFAWQSEPDNVAGRENCGVIRTTGNFSDRDCNSNKHYICKRYQDVSNGLTNMGCGSWQRAGHYCYNFYTTPLATWANARSMCQQAKGDLMSVRTLDEKNWITLQTTIMDRGRAYWVGLNDQSSEGKYVWADNTPVNISLIKWNQEPNDWYGSEDCGKIFNSGSYNDADCTMQAAVICELPGQTSCPSSAWVSRATAQGVKDCYLFTNGSTTYSWSEGLTFCISLSPARGQVPSLLAVSDPNEKSWIEQTLKGLPQLTSGWWTGLTDRAQEGYWMFYGQNVIVDPALVNWGGEPTNVLGTEDCGAINYGGRYFTYPCDVKTYFICQRPVSAKFGSQAGESNIIKCSWLLLGLCVVVRLLEIGN